MLVIVHHRNVQFFFEATLNLKSLRRLDIFQVDSSKSRRNGLDSIDKGFYISGIDLYVKYINIGKNLKEQAFTLHHRFGCISTYVTQAKHGGTIGDYCHEVSFVGISVSIVFVFFNRQARLCHSRRVGQREVILGGVFLSRYHGYLPWLRELVIVKGIRVFLMIIIFHLKMFLSS